MIIVTATARLRAETRDRALAAAREMAERTAKEAGCREYRFWTAVDDPDQVLLFERWKDEASLAAHLAATHTLEFGATIVPLAEGSLEVTRYEVTD
jgi:quinol monooxygenase YgiN